jgi:hypothetical protein
MASVKLAASLPGVSVVSMSWGFTERQLVSAEDEALYDTYLTTPAGHQGVTFVASTGDYGTANPEYPAFSSNVVAVGGTSLLVNADGTYQGETGWGALSQGGAGEFYGSGGGLSQFESMPLYQQGVQSTGFRSSPDVSMVADPSTGAWVADAYNLPGDNPWAIVGGTSLSAPSWAGLILLANQARAEAGQATLNSTGPTETQQALYNLPLDAFHDVTTGSNGGYEAGIGYDLVSGLGTPVADRLVPALAAYNGEGAQLSQRLITINGNGGYSDNNTPASLDNPTGGFNARLISASGLHSNAGSANVNGPTLTAGSVTNMEADPLALHSASGKDNKQESKRVAEAHACAPAEEGWFGGLAPVKIAYSVWQSAIAQWNASSHVEPSSAELLSAKWASSEPLDAIWGAELATPNDRVRAEKTSDASERDGLFDGLASLHTRNPSKLDELSSSTVQKESSKKSGPQK